jgi:serine protease Do
VLAVSCATGEYELVGIYHAGYTQGSALNVVIAIDQVRDLMTTLRRTPREHVAETPALDATTRRRLTEAVAAEGEVFFPFGGNVAVVRAGADGALLFEVFARDFPVTVEPIAILEDLAPIASSAFGMLGRVWFGSARGLKVYAPGAGGSAEGLAPLDRDADLSTGLALDALRSDASAYVGFRAQQRQTAPSRQTLDGIARAGKVLARTAGSRAEVLQSLADEGERFGPAHNDPVTHLAEILAPPATQSRPPASAPTRP